MENVATNSKLEELGDKVTEILTDVAENPKNYSKEERSAVIERMRNFLDWYDEKVKDRPELQV